MQWLQNTMKPYLINKLDQMICHIRYQSYRDIGNLKRDKNQADVIYLFIYHTNKYFGTYTKKQSKVTNKFS